jgi:hypothetical protein
MKPRCGIGLLVWYPDGILPKPEPCSSKGSARTNEPIPAAQPSEIANLKSQIEGELPNEAMRGGVKRVIR